jgi:hypothetical protein
VSAIEVTTQAQLDKALKNLKPGDYVVCLGGSIYSPLVVRGSSHVEAWESSHVEARGSSHVVARGSSHVEAWESSHVVAWGSSHVVAWGSSHVVARESSHVVARGSSHVEAWESSHVVAWGSSHVVARGSSHVEAWESSHVVAWGSSHVVAWGSSHVVARESSHVVATPYVAVTKQTSHRGTIAGGVIIEIPEIRTAADWINFHRLTVKRGLVTLYKAVDDDWRSGYGFAYTPGTKPACDDWEPHPGCGQGLHFTAHPLISKSYMSEATRYVACPIKVAEIVVIDNEKVKAPRVAGTIYEVGEDREPILAKVAA